MKNLTLGKSFIAIFTALVFALLILCASVATHFTNAYAEEGYSLYDDIINIAAFNGSFNTSAERKEVNCLWGIFYCGIGYSGTDNKLKKVNWQDGSDSGTITFSYDGVITLEGFDETPDGKIIKADSAGNSFTWDENHNDIADTPLRTNQDHPTHDFIAKAGSDSWDFTDTGDMHWAVCADMDCGLELELPHRPDDRGVCVDCGKDLIDRTNINTYAFTDIPEELGGEGVEWSNNEVTFEISVTATLCAGDTLELYLACSGELSNGAGDTIYYTIEVNGTTYDDDTYTEPIWSYQAPIESVGFYSSLKELQDYFANNPPEEISDTITITLIIDENTVQYPGTYTDTLTFSAELEYEEEY